MRGSAATSQIASNNEGGGKAAFDPIKQLNPNGGKVMVMSTGPGRVYGGRAGQGLRGRRQGRLQVHLPARPVLARRPGHRLEPDGLRSTEGPDIVGVFAANLFAAEGTANGVKTAGKAKTVKIVSFDAGPNQVNALNEGTVQALIASSRASSGNTASTRPSLPWTAAPSPPRSRPASRPSPRTT